MYVYARSARTSPRRPPRRLIGPELGFGLGKSPLGVEGGAAFDIERGGGSPHVGVSGGMGFKATVCYYWLSDSKKTGSCSGEK